MQIIAFQRPDGGVSVVVPAAEFSDQLTAVAQKDVPEGCPWRIIDDSELPAREVRNLWRWTDTGPLSVATSE